MSRVVSLVIVCFYDEHVFCVGSKYSNMLDLNFTTKSPAGEWATADAHDEPRGAMRRE